MGNSQNSSYLDTKIQLDMKTLYNNLNGTEKQLIKDITKLMLETLMENYRSLILTFSYLTNCEYLAEKEIEHLNKESTFIIWLGKLKKYAFNQKKYLKGYRLSLLKDLWPKLESEESDFSRDLKLLVDSSPKCLDIFFKDNNKDWGLKSQLEEMITSFDFKNLSEKSQKIKSRSQRGDLTQASKIRSKSSLTSDRNSECKPKIMSFIPNTNIEINDEDITNDITDKSSSKKKRNIKNFIEKNYQNQKEEDHFIKRSLFRNKNNKSVSNNNKISENKIMSLNASMNKFQTRKRSKKVTQSIFDLTQNQNFSITNFNRVEPDLVKE